MKEILKNSASLYLKIVVVSFMCSIVVLSINILANGFFSKEVGYKAFGTIENEEGKEESKELYLYYYEDGEDTERAKYEAEGYEISEYKLKELSANALNTATVVSQIFCFFLLATFVYPTVWDIGFKDGNKVKFKRIEPDKFKGLKIGLLAQVPGVVFLIFLFAAQGITKNIPIDLYKLVTAPLYGFIELVKGDASTFGNLKVLNFIFILLLHLIVPVIAHISYILGLKNYSIGEKLIFKKNK